MDVPLVLILMVLREKKGSGITGRLILVFDCQQSKHEQFTSVNLGCRPSIDLGMKNNIHGKINITDCTVSSNNVLE